MNYPLRTLTSRDKYPCYQNGERCTKRHPGCHDTCTEYLQAKAANEARKSIERERRVLANDVNRFKAAQAAKSTHKKLKER